MLWSHGDVVADCGGGCFFCFVKSASREGM